MNPMQIKQHYSTSKQHLILGHMHLPDKIADWHFTYGCKMALAQHGCCDDMYLQLLTCCNWRWGLLLLGAPSTGPDALATGGEEDHILMSFLAAVLPVAIALFIASANIHAACFVCRSSLTGDYFKIKILVWSHTKFQSTMTFFKLPYGFRPGANSGAGATLVG